MDIPFTELGVGGILAIIILDRVFSFLKERNGGGKAEAIGADTMKMRMQVDEIYTERKYIGSAINKLNSTLDKQTTAMIAIAQEAKETKYEIRKLRDDLE